MDSTATFKHASHKTICKAPAKLILSGEHAVLYQCPALSLAIQIYSTCECEYTSVESVSDNLFSITLIDYQQKMQFKSTELSHRAEQIESLYQRFLNAEIDVTEVLSKPTDLFVVALDLFQKQQRIKPGHWKFTIKSDIPTGRGLGSSASVIVSFLLSLYKQHHIKVDPAELLSLAKEVESRQHGQSSGLDPATIINGGLIHYQNGKIINGISPPNIKAWLIDTGKPKSSTGEAVQQVKQQHAQNTALWNEFSACSLQILQTLTQPSIPDLPPLIKQNQALLNRLGIVPQVMQSFIEKLHPAHPSSHAINAKLCGSGSVKGDNAGIVFAMPLEQNDSQVIKEAEKNIQQLCQQAKYSLLKVDIALHGAHCEECHEHTNYSELQPNSEQPA